MQNKNNKYFYFISMHSALYIFDVEKISLLLKDAFSAIHHVDSTYVAIDDPEYHTDATIDVLCEQMSKSLRYFELVYNVGTQHQPYTPTPVAQKSIRFEHSQHRQQVAC